MSHRAPRRSLRPEGLLRRIIVAATILLLLPALAASAGSSRGVQAIRLENSPGVAPVAAPPLHAQGVLDGAVTSDDFNALELDSGLWSFIDPLGDSSLVMTGTQARIEIPAGDETHDVWTNGNTVPRLLQAVSDTDFEIEVKFESSLFEDIQIQGLLFEENSNRLLRVEFHHLRGETRLFAAAVLGDQATIELIEPLALTVPMFLRVRREGHTWTISHSLDGAEWTVEPSFVRQLAVSAVGVFAGNSAATPHTATIDYFFNRAMPIEPEDAMRARLTVESEGQGTVLVDPDQADYDLGETVRLTARPAPGWSFLRWEGDLSGSSNPAELRLTGNLGVRAVFAMVEPLYREDFSSYPWATDPSDWIDTGPENSLLRQDLFHVWGVDGDRALRTLSTARDIHSHYVGPQSASLTDYAYTGRMRINSATGCIGVTALSQFPRRPAYYALRRCFSGPFRLEALGARISGVAVDTGVVPAAGLWYRFRLEAESDETKTLLRAKVWRDGEAEPASWQAAAVDDSGTRWTQGTIGVWSYYSGAKFWDDLTIAELAPAGETASLSVSTSGAGQVLVDPDLPSYTPGQSVTLTALPAPGWIFAGWSGDLSGNANPATVVVEGAMEILVRFTEDPSAAPPLLSGIGVNAEARQATVSWFTSKPATGRVDYGLTTAYSESVSDETLRTGHVFRLEGLEPETLYHLQVSSVDAAGNLVASGDVTFLTESEVPPLGPFSDDFRGSELKSEIWRFVNPLDDATLELTGTRAVIHVPGNGTLHDIWTELNTVPRLMQSVENRDFEVVAKFDSALARDIQLQGILVEQDEQHVIRIEFHQVAGQRRVFAASILGDQASIHALEAVELVPPMLLRVSRSGDRWTVAHSPDGVAWSEAASFLQPLEVRSLGVFAGNSAETPHSAWVDYFFDASKPIEPEDGGPVTLEVQSFGAGTVTVNPELPLYDPGQLVQLTAIPDAGWSFVGWGGDVTGTSNPVVFELQQSASVTATFVAEVEGYREDFSSYPAGADPTDWRDTRAENSLLVDDSLFRVASVVGNPALFTGSTSRDIHSHWVGPDSRRLANYRYGGRMMISSSSGGIGVTVLSQFPVRAGYYALRRYFTSDFRLEALGTRLSGGTTRTGVVPAPGNWYRFEIEVRDTGERTELRAKVWPDGSPEPAAWQAEAYDSSSTRLRAGTIGVWSFYSGKKYWDDLSVGP